MRPRVTTRPVVGWMMPATICSSVLLPQPLGPTRPRVSPFSTVKPISRSAQKSVCIGVSHAGEMVAIAISARTVGVDIEAASRRVEVEPLLRLLAPDEATAIGAHGEPTRTTEFLRAWTKKEAGLKASGAGIAGMRLED